MATDLNAQLRTEMGSGPSYRLRQEQTLPAVLYGKGVENKNLQVNALEVERILRTKIGKNTFINLKVEGDKDYGVLIREYQGDVLTRRVTHIDFWSVDPAREVEVNLRTRIVGKAPGVVQGGILEQAHHTVKLACRADSIPADVEVDISNLGLSQNIHLADVTLPEGVKAREGYNPTIISCVTEKGAEEPAPAAAEGAAAPAAAQEKPAS